MRILGKGICNCFGSIPSKNIVSEIDFLQVGAPIQQQAKLRTMTNLGKYHHKYSQEFRKAFKYFLNLPEIKHILHKDYRITHFKIFTCYLSTFQQPLPLDPQCSYERNQPLSKMDGPENG